MTHTFATLEISAAAYDEIRGLLDKAEYQHTFMEDGTIDIHGIGLVKSEKKENPHVTKLENRADYNTKYGDDRGM